MNDAAPRPGLRCAGWALALLVALDFALRAAVAFRPIEATDGITTDDTFYCLHVARSIARGDGPLYGLAATNGFQPLYVFLVAPFHWIWPSDPVPPVHASLLLLAAVDALTLWAIVRWCRTIATQTLVPWIVAVAWITDAYAARTSLNGMESMVAVLCGVLALTSLDRTLRSGEARPADAARFGALVGLAGLARIDALFLGPIGVGFAAVQACRGKLGVPSPLRAAGSCAAAFALVYGPWVAYSIHHTGTAFPVSGQAVRAMTEASAGAGTGNSSLDLLAMTFVQHRDQHPALLALVAGGVLAALVAARRALSARLRAGLVTLLSATLFGLVLVAAYTAWIRAWWHLPRYVFPTTIALLLALAIVFDALLAAAAGRARAWAAAVAFAVLTAQAGFGAKFRDLYTSTPNPLDGFVEIGLWARENLPPGARVGATQSGSIGYFATQCTVVNLDGVVNADALRAWRAGRLLPYLREADVAYVLAVTPHEAFIRGPSPDAGAPRLERVLAVAGIRTGATWRLLRVADPCARRSGPGLDGAREASASDEPREEPARPGSRAAPG